MAVAAQSVDCAKHVKPQLPRRPNAGDNLEAVQVGRWKLHVRKGAETMNALYDLTTDIGETQNVYGQHPDVVQRLSRWLERCRHDLGDAATGIAGNCRPIGRVNDPAPLTSMIRIIPISWRFTTWRTLANCPSQQSSLQASQQASKPASKPASKEATLTGPLSGSAGRGPV